MGRVGAGWGGQGGSRGGGKGPGHVAELEAHYPIRRSRLTGTLEPVQAFFFLNTKKTQIKSGFHNSVLASAKDE